ncbi:MAG: nuclease-related domain-containing protein, partial [Candidatus Thermoplasmatota archaeon]|nr:nuclease-related domain-containing protein [Candidatus Thermoplasmatota archaeon]
MGLLKNYRLLKSQKQHSAKALSKQDRLKRSGTKKELELYRKLSKLKSVHSVYHSVRLSKIEGGRGRKEVDLIVICSGKICLIEVKNYSGLISMNENGDLLQNEELRGWNFNELDESKRRLTNILRQVGIDLKDVEVNTNLALLGSGTTDDSVTVGRRYTSSSVFSKISDIKKFVSAKTPNVVELSEEKLEAISKALEMCGTWDKIVLTNGRELEGDIFHTGEVGEWRRKYSKLSFINQRGWLSTLFFGPKYFAESYDNDGRITLIPIPLQTMLQLQLPGKEREKIECEIYQLDSCNFGYQQIPDWQNITLYQDISEDESSPFNESEEQYEVGQIIKNATVDNHHKDGIFFRLDSMNSGMSFKNQFNNFEWENRKMFFTVGKQLDVIITRVKEI